MQQGFQPPAELQETFQNVFKYGNTLGKSPRQRLDWAKDLDVRVLDLSKEPRPVEVLVAGRAAIRRTIRGTRSWPGPSPGSSPSWASTWGVLGAKEKAVGECDRMFGEEGLFETLVEENRKLLGQARFRQDRRAGPARLPGFAELLSALRRLVSRAALHDLPRRAAGATQAAAGQAGRGHGHLSRQLLRWAGVAGATIRRGRCWN